MFKSLKIAECVSPNVHACLGCGHDHLREEAAGHKPFCYRNLERGVQGTAFALRCPKCNSIFDINDWSRGQDETGTPGRPGKRADVVHWACAKQYTVGPAFSLCCPSRLSFVMLPQPLQCHSRTASGMFMRPSTATLSGSSSAARRVSARCRLTQCWCQHRHHCCG